MGCVDASLFRGDEKKKGFALLCLIYNTVFVQSVEYVLCHGHLHFFHFRFQLGTRNQTFEETVCELLHRGTLPVLEPLLGVSCFVRWEEARSAPRLGTRDEIGKGIIALSAAKTNVILAKIQKVKGSLFV